MRIRTFYDTAGSPAELPASGDGYLVYRDGRYANEQAARLRFPHKTVVAITVNGGTTPPMIDCETGDVSPRSAALWARLQRDKDGRPRTIYFPLSWYPQVAAACKSVKLKPGRDVFFFAARYGLDGTIPAGFVGVQYLSPDGPANARPKGHYDVSHVVPDWPGVDPKRRFSKLRTGPRRNARALNRAIAKRRVTVTGKADRSLLAALAAEIRRVLGRK